MEVQRVIVTDDARVLIHAMREKHGTLVFHQSGGCCDGSAPMCLPADEFMIDDNDVYLGDIAGVPFYMSVDQFEYWKHTQLTIDITKGRGSSFSLEIPTGYRFITKSRMFNEDELKQLSETAN